MTVTGFDLIVLGITGNIPVIIGERKRGIVSCHLFRGSVFFQLYFFRSISHGKRFWFESVLCK